MEFHFTLHHKENPLNMSSRKQSRFARLIAITTLAVTAFMYISIHNSNEAAAEPAVYLVQGNSYAQEWMRVDSLESKGLYKSALDLTNQIYAKAKKENNSAQIVKSIMHRMKFEDRFMEYSAERSIYTLQAEIKTAKYPLKPVLQHMLANLYWQYYQNNRWTILQRSTTVKFENDSVDTWGVQQLVNACIQNYQASLSMKDSLQKTDSKMYIAVTEEGTAAHELRPTLYDFLVFPAIQFYASSEPGITRPADAFVIDDPQYFLPAKQFVNVKIESNDTMSMKYYGLKHLQELVRFHLADTRADALILADLDRLKFVRQNSVLPEKDSLYEDALRQLAANYGSNPYSGEVMYEVALYHNQLSSRYAPLQNDDFRNENIRALEICNEVIKRFPNTLGEDKCTSLANIIKAKSMNLTAEDVVIPDEPSRALFTWKNVNKVYFRAVKLTEELESRYDYRSWEDQVKAYLKRPIVAKWEYTLPENKDFQNHSVEIKVPGLPAGHYAIIASQIDSFPMSDNGIAIAEIWSSNISYLQRRMEDGSYEVFVYNRKSGVSIPDVNINMWEERYSYTTREYEMKKTASFVSDKNGKLVIATPANYRTFILEFQANKNRLYSDFSYQYKAYREPKRKEPRTFFFTDRAIYRPGQTVYYKGIIVNSDGDNHDLMTGKSTTVTFYDANYQKVGSTDLLTNEYGSFSGSFIAPAAGMTGQMHLQNESGSSYFSVEEYKRPHFEVNVHRVKGAYRLNDTVKVQGQVKSFSGAAVDGAQVRYRVVRSARFPWWWWCWRGYYPSSQSVEIANGVVMSNDTGGFEIPFKALPDRSVPRASDPVFMYTVYTDVTDITGETHSGNSMVSVGYNTIELSIPVDEMIEKNNTDSISVSVNNLNGEPEPSDVNVAIYKVVEPDVVYRDRMWGRPDQFIHTAEEWEKQFPFDPYSNENDRAQWKKGKQVYNSAVKTPKPGKFRTDMKSWESGLYLLEASTKDKFGNEAKEMRYFTVYDNKEKTPYTKSPFEFRAVKSNCQPGEKAQILVSTSLKDVNLVYEIEHKNKIISRQVVKMNNEMRLFEIPVEEKHRGNFAVHFSFVSNNRSYTTDQSIYVPFENTNLSLEFETFRDKLIPGQQEEWKIKLKGSKGEKVMAEMLAAMYDASLDEFRSNYFSFYLYRSYYSNTYWMNNVQGITDAQLWNGDWNEYSSWTERTYDHLNWFGYYMSYNYRGYTYGWADDMDGDMPVMKNMEVLQEVSVSGQTRGGKLKKESAAKPAPSPGVTATGGAKDVTTVLTDSVAELDNRKEQSGEDKEGQSGDVKVRSNLNETVFFFPHLETDSSGAIIIKFTMNEALTKWKFMALAHTKDLKYGFIQKEVVTQKDLMVVPHAPRFLREGDEIVMTAKVSNLSDTVQNGTADLILLDALTQKDITKELLADKAGATRTFTAPKGQSAPVAWNLKIPFGYGAVQYKVIARAGNFSDGEENALPVLSNRILVTETLPLPIRGGQTKEFRFEKLINQSNGSNTLVNHRLTLEFTSNPAWYAVQALPYMMEYPYECAEQTFTRYYSNAIASHIANSSPKMKAVFDSWKNQTPDAFLSNLEKNQELKSAVLEETPWVLDAKDETERKRRVGLLFDMNKMANESDRSMRKLRQMQVSNGGWPWFEGMPDDRYITQHIICGFGKLDHLGITAVRTEARNWDMVKDGVRYMDARIAEDYEWILKWDAAHKDDDHLGYLQIHYLYARSYFMDIPMSERTKKAFDYYQGQMKKYWTNKSRYMQGMLAIEAFRNKETAASTDIMKSLKETAIVSEEMGMYWKDMAAGGWYWYQAPIESQALMVEAFHEVSNDQKSVDDIRVWLLKNKQTNDWKTTKATVEACYALLIQGTDWLATESDVTIVVGNQTIDPKAAGVHQEAGTGYFKMAWTGKDIAASMGKITVKKAGPGVSWGAMYWQYFEDMDKVTPANTSLKVVKKLFVTRYTASGPVIEPVTEQTVLKPGDKIKVRIELRTDRDLEYVHMKDMRASGFEPINVFSQYKWQDGLGYYESTRDASTNFFFPYLKKGSYVFEYPLFVAHEGNFSNGITTVQCMYAPEFAAHSEGMRVKVGK
jgi:uncharacterized protein YfaS (alpha-2-macroglobulin family)